MKKIKIGFLSLVFISSFSSCSLFDTSSGRTSYSGSNDENLNGNNASSSQPIGCQSSSDCATNEYCDTYNTQTCQPQPCMYSYDCATGMVCDTSVSPHACKSPLGDTCSAGSCGSISQYCDTSAHPYTCKPQPICYSNGMCASGQICDMSGTIFSCINNNVATGCPATPCPSYGGHQQVCVSGTCKCTAENQCPTVSGAQEFCSVAGVCTPRQANECSGTAAVADAQCNSKFYCDPGDPEFYCTLDQSPIICRHKLYDGSSCSRDGECYSTWCYIKSTVSGAAGTCSSPIHSLGIYSVCGRNEDCASNWCYFSGSTATSGVCRDTTDLISYYGYCDPSFGHCVANAVCNSSLKQCIKQNLGTGIVCKYTAECANSSTSTCRAAFSSTIGSCGYTTGSKTCQDKGEAGDKCASVSDCTSPLHCSEVYSHHPNNDGTFSVMYCQCGSGSGGL